MKCFTFDGGVMTPGLFVTDTRLGKAVFLGKEGRNRRYEIVPLWRSDPPEVEDELVLEAFPLERTLRGSDWEREVVFLAAAMNASDPRVLLRVSTEFFTHHICGGYWSNIAGNPKTIIVGHGTYDDIPGRVPQWNDGLVILQQRDAIRIRCDHHTEYVVALEKDGLICLSLETYKRQQAPVPATAATAS